MNTNGDNIYESSDTVKYKKVEQEIANDLYKKSKDTMNTNVMISGPPISIINSNNNNNNNNLPIEFEMDSKIIDTNKIKHISNNNYNNINLQYSSNKESGGWNTITNETQISQLTGEKFENYHNNCVPYFGSRVTQNVDANATNTILDNMTGTDKVYREKCEIPVMFKPTTNVTNPYGSQSLDSDEYERYIVGNIRNNESPIEKVYVGPEQSPTVVNNLLCDHTLNESGLFFSTMPTLPGLLIFLPEIILPLNVSLGLVLVLN